jgi:hypothetical protein
LVATFSSLQTSRVFDRQTFSEFLYADPKYQLLKIHHMSLDYAEFPPLSRNVDLITNEYSRIRLLKERYEINKT